MRTQLSEQERDVFLSISNTGDFFKNSQRTGKDEWPSESGISTPKICYKVIKPTESIVVASSSVTSGLVELLLSDWPIVGDPQTVKDWTDNFVCDALHENNPFTQKDLPTEKENQLHNQIVFFKIISKIKSKDKIIERINELLNHQKEDNPSDIGISINSLSNFLYFCQNKYELINPMITLAPDNSIYTTWKKQRNKLLSVNFLDDGNVVYVLFKPDSENPEKTIRITKTILSNKLDEEINSYGIWDWITE